MICATVNIRFTKGPLMVDDKVLCVWFNIVPNMFLN